MILDNIWSIYTAIDEYNYYQMEKIVQVLNLSKKVNLADLKNKSITQHSKLTSILSQWLPISQSILHMVVRQIPSPNQAQSNRMHKLWPILDNDDEQKDTEHQQQIVDSLPSTLCPLFKKAVLECDKTSPHLLVYISESS